MKKSRNFVHHNLKRELDLGPYAKVLERKFKVTDNFIKRLGLFGELDGHTGCVNCLEWNKDGSLLASGSDDVCVNIYSPLRKKLIASIPSGHQGNIFSVKFVPNSNDRLVISGAADHLVKVHEVTSKETLSVCSCHYGRVKRIVTDVTAPDLYWSAGEDGLIIQHDFREPHTCAASPKKTSNVLIDLKPYLGNKAEAKCLSLNPVRPEIIAIGANDPFVRLYDRRMIKLREETESEDDAVAPGAVKYFVPGHLPPRLSEYKKKHRSLASTYVAFSPDGQELLVNLGGEQIYLFPVNTGIQVNSSRFIMAEKSGSPSPLTDAESLPRPSNGYKNGHVVLDSPLVFGKYSEKHPLPPNIEAIKVKANEAFEAKKYALAIQLYNEAIHLYPKSALLYGNRGAALLKRAWDSDVYESLKDCFSAITIDYQHYKAHLRLCRCLYELSRFEDATLTLNQFKQTFPKFVSTNAVRTMESDLLKALKSSNSPKRHSSTSSSAETSSTSNTSDQSITTESSPSPHSNESSRDRNFFLRFASSAFGSDTSHSEDRSSIDESELAFLNDLGPLGSPSLDSSEGSSIGDDPRNGRPRSSKKPRFDNLELDLQNMALDYSERFCGHCNTTTDIKEANFFGNYIVAGSDDGSFFVWNRETTNIVKVIRGDESIVNCLQPHPSMCLLATSGLESVIRLWSPLAENENDDNVQKAKDKDDRTIDDWDSVASANQKRMKSNPFELILMNMGYRINNSGGGEDDPDANDEPAELDGPSIRCNQT